MWCVPMCLWWGVLRLMPVPFTGLKREEIDPRVGMAAVGAAR